MKLFRRTDTTQQVPAELQPYYDGDTGWKVWIRRIVYVIVALLVLFAIGWAAWAVYNRLTDDGADTKNTPIGQNEDKSSNNDNKATTDDKTNKDKVAEDNKDTKNNDAAKSQDSSGSSDTKNQPASLPSGESSESGNKEGSSAAANQNIPKTGPEDAVAVAIGASILGAIFHRLFLSRRQMN